MRRGPLAHREEQGTFNPKVRGSRPRRPTEKDLADSLWIELVDGKSGALATGRYCVTGAATGEPVAEASWRRHEGPPSPTGQRVGATCLCRNRSDHQPPEVPHPHLPGRRARGRRGTRSLHQRGVRRWPRRPRHDGRRSHPPVARPRPPRPVAIDCPGYEQTIRSHITPTLGKVPLARLRTTQLDRFYAQLREKGG